MTGPVDEQIFSGLTPTEQLEELLNVTLHMFLMLWEVEERKDTEDPGAMARFVSDFGHMLKVLERHIIIILPPDKRKHIVTTLREDARHAQQQEREWQKTRECLGDSNARTQAEANSPEDI